MSNFYVYFLFTSIKKYFLIKGISSEKYLLYKLKSFYFYSFSLITSLKFINPFSRSSLSLFFPTDINFSFLRSFSSTISVSSSSLNSNFILFNPVSFSTHIISSSLLCCNSSTSRLSGSSISLNDSNSLYHIFTSFSFSSPSRSALSISFL